MKRKASLHKVKLRKFPRLGRQNKLFTLVFFAVGFMVIGASLQLLTRAATPVASFEAEVGIKTSPAVTEAVAGASGGTAIKFGAAATAPPTGTTRFAGHIPGRVFLGMAASESLRPKYAEALQITGTVYERRQFSSGWFTATSMNNMLNDCDANNQYCVISFKAPNNNDWAGMANGRYNADLDAIMAVARSRTKPFAFGVHHEPQNDGVAEQWAAMQEHLVQYLSPVNNIMAFTTIANGFWWGPNNGKTEAYIATYYPQSLLTKMNQHKAIVAADFYDAFPDASGNYKATADRTSLKLQAFTTWARGKGLKSVGAGEFGTTSGPELTKSWRVMHDNRDVWSYANYFNSLANSIWDWRLLPDSYPAYNTGNALDKGGTLESQARLNAFKAAVTESATPR